MYTFIDRRNLPRKNGGHWHLSLCVLLQLEKNTPEVPKLNVFQITLQLDLVLEEAFVPGNCNLYYRGGWCVLWDLTWSSIARFANRRCFCTLELATSTLEGEGVFVCTITTRARVYPVFYNKIWQWKVLKYSGACYFYYRGRRCVPLWGFNRSSIVRFGSRSCFCTLELASSTIEVEGEFLCGSITRARSHLQFYF